jgi:hypothetical protein
MERNRILLLALETGHGGGWTRKLKCMSLIPQHCPQEVLIFLTFLTSLLQYTVQRMTYKNDLRRIETIISNAKLAAWGPKMVPVDGKRKVCIHSKNYDYSCSIVGTRRSKYLLVGLHASMMKAIKLVAE